MIPVRNPRTGEVDYEIHQYSAEELHSIAAEQRVAQIEWAARPMEERLEIIYRWVDKLEARRDDIRAALSADTGRGFLALGEVGGIRPLLDQWKRIGAEVQPGDTETPATGVDGLSYKTQLVPYPLVGVISPWNFPLLLSFIDTLPALVAGCSVIVKPSEVTPRFVAPLVETIAEVPELAAVLKFVTGDGVTGAALVDQVDCVCFTGSVATGRKVGDQCADRFIPAFLELGGKDPVIVMPSADPKDAAATVLRASVQGTGQACQSLERVYVHDSIAKEFTSELVSQAEQVGINWPDMSQGHIGPLIFAAQADIIQGQLDDAVADGAKILTGGQVEEHGGHWLKPTVIVDVTHDMRLMQEETFGPVMPVMTFADPGEAIALANDSEFGLSGAVIAETVEEAEMIASQLNVGAVSINDAGLTGRIFEAEKNSFNLSGIGGSRMGPAGITRFYRRRALLIQRGDPIRIDHLAESNLPG